jgi:hypothetical protein
MASTKISAMSAATTPDYNAPIPVVQSGNNFTLTKRQVQAFQPSGTTFSGSSSVVCDGSITDYFRIYWPANRVGNTLGFSNLQDGKEYVVFMNATDVSGFAYMTFSNGINTAIPGAGVDGFWADNTSWIWKFISINGVARLVSAQNQNGLIA